MMQFQSHPFLQKFLLAPSTRGEPIVECVDDPSPESPFSTYTSLLTPFDAMTRAKGDERSESMREQEVNQVKGEEMEGKEWKKVMRLGNRLE